MKHETDDELATPCYVIGPREVTFEDGWCYGDGYVVADSRDYEADHAAIIADIRENVGKRMGARSFPCYLMSDHGNLHRTRSCYVRGNKAGAL